MLKTQKKFNPLECVVCKHYDCKYKDNSEQLYNIGFKIPINDCPKLRNLRDAKREVIK